MGHRFSNLKAVKSVPILVCVVYPSMVRAEYSEMRILYRNV